MTYSLKFRLHVLAVREAEGLSYAQTAKRFCVGVASLVRWGNHPEPAKKRNKPPTKLSMDALVEDIKQYPDGYLYERARRLHVSKSGVQHAIKRLGITHKKRRSNTQEPMNRHGPTSRKKLAVTNKKESAWFG